MVKFSSADARSRGCIIFLVALHGHRIWFILHGRDTKTLRGIGKCNLMILTPYTRLNSAKELDWALDYLKNNVVYISCLLFDWKSGREVLGRDAVLLRKKKRIQFRGQNAKHHRPRHSVHKW